MRIPYHTQMKACAHTCKILNLGKSYFYNLQRFIFFSSIKIKIPEFINIKAQNETDQTSPIFFYIAFNPPPKMAIGDPWGFTPPSHKSSPWKWQPGQAGPEWMRTKSFSDEQNKGTTREGQLSLIPLSYIRLLKSQWQQAI